ncbi:amino acid ABC transporter permease [Methylobacterium sp. WL30]|uniref:amino acid ABC transporter permease n=1 Tax=unclassified Methylobacterium TaxID=2615210 RepID=UPI0011C7962F|nr:MULTISPECIES: amino acid ABC transporter permease [unclassified Methylobacterium]TXM93927.1 amino acid ABC transporter permease [Methylobacterium sp. WL116]TXN41395.1 amino acid ABC transporter permease [Methylobacterium sp. WL93]TXN49776.1 amino acid ABC transporter permease [Methylobacterium sp. WL119]TXN63835.1 amino acid ABC transporter permease [Methylobacterium sp. WL30]
MGAYQFRWDVIPANIGFLMSGVGMTLLISALTLVFATFGGLVIAAMSASRLWPARAVAYAFGEVIRNTPILVQLLWVYYVLPMLLGIRLDALTASIIGLSIYSSAFIAEVFRAGIQAVPVGHREAAQVLGLSQGQAFVRIVLPQAVRLILPPLAANFVQLIKYSSLASVISVGEVTRRGMELSSSTFRPLEIFTFIGLVYFAICWPLTQSIRMWERRLACR